jgi:hypothetical protein
MGRRVFSHTPELAIFNNHLSSFLHLHCHIHIHILFGIAWARLVTTPSTSGTHFFSRRTGGSEFGFALSALQSRHVMR